MRKHKVKIPPNTTDLKTWMFEEEITIQTLATELGCSIGTICKWKQGRVPDIWKLVLAIESLSKGRVTFYNLAIQKKKKKKDADDDQETHQEEDNQGVI